MEESKLVQMSEEQREALSKLPEQSSVSVQGGGKVNTKAPSSPPKLTGEFVTDIIKIGSVIASISAILHLYGFGLAANINILAYVSLTDFLKVAIGWVAPSFILQFVVGFSVPGFVSYLKPEKSSSLKVPQKDNCPYCKYENYMGKLFITTFLLLDLAIILLVIFRWFNIDSKTIFELLTFIGIAGWITLIIWCTKSTKDFTKIGYDNARLFLLGPLLLIFSVGTGLAHGSISSRLKSRDLVSVISNNITQQYGEMLFSFEKYIVIREIGHSDITFIPSDKITSIKTSISIPTTTPLPSLKKK